MKAVPTRLRIGQNASMAITLSPRTSTGLGLACATLSLALLGRWELRANAAPPEDLPGGWAEGIEGAWGLAHVPTQTPSGIEGIGYAGGFEEASLTSGVTRFERASAQPGFNLYCSGHAPEAFLMDMEGRVLHSWKCSWLDIPDAPPLESSTQNTFRRVALLPDGHLLAIYGGRGMVRLDANSNVVWSYHERAHHDLEVLPDGSIWTLIRRDRSVPRINRGALIVDDYAVRLSPEGKELERHSILDALLNSRWSKLLPTGAKLGGDILHTNSIRLLGKDASKAHPSLSAGDLLLCIRELDLVCSLDTKRHRMTWGTVGPWRAPHDPTLTPDGKLLIFDNAGHGGFSRVIELDLRGAVPTWMYAGTPPEAFSSLFCGSARRLPNGNTLIAESTRGRVLEVTTEGQVVWEFTNPKRAGNNKALVAAIFDLVRLPADLDLSWL